MRICSITTTRVFLRKRSKEQATCLTCHTVLSLSLFKCVGAPLLDQDPTALSRRNQKAGLTSDVAVLLCLPPNNALKCHVGDYKIATALNCCAPVQQRLLWLLLCAPPKRLFYELAQPLKEQRPLHCLLAL